MLLITYYVLGGPVFVNVVCYFLYLAVLFLFFKELRVTFVELLAVLPSRLLLVSALLRFSNGPAL